MTRHRINITGVAPAVVALVALVTTTGTIRAQTKTTTDSVKGAAAVVSSASMTGVVDWVQGDTLVARMRPQGDYKVFIVQAGREFVIDGQTKHIADLKPGTVLTATVTTTTRPVTVRTTSVLNGTVWWVQGNYVILTLENGENHEYQVPASFKFQVEGKRASVSELRKGMKVSASKIIEEPHTELATNTAITGTAPK